MSVEETVPPREQEQPETAGSVARDRPGETPRKVLSENRDEKLSAKAEAATGEKPKGRGFRPDGGGSVFVEIGLRRKSS